MLNRRKVPAYRPDIYSTKAILDPYPHYARLRELGPVVWLTRQRVYALPRYAECKAALRDDTTFVSGHGVALNAVTNRLSRGTTLNSDGEDHDKRRKLVAHRLTPKALRAMSDAVTNQAEQVVAAAVAKRTVDGVSDLASALPLAIVPDFVGWPREGRDHLLTWAGATFDFLGPANKRSIRAFPASLQMLRFARQVVRERSALDRSMGHDVLAAVDNGTLKRSEVPPLMVDYLAPSLDTTISAIASGLHLFATHPDQWQAIRNDPSLIPNAVNEVVRIESPLRAFSRRTTRDVDIAGTTIPKGARVLVMYASANRDELQWTDPDTFDVHRDATGQLGFGIGAHTCAGQGLARMETQAILTALAKQVDTIRCTAPPTWGLNNIIHCFERLPLELIPAGKE
ncbi:cytochrome P450 [Mycobacterium sp. Y57]|uniref:cytochrome P450 n=1 Tax=Mycolicibacterium xanthum TaxID=2796469 RepID=UPI001C84343C|nr:cytochrome P450 [Mycolicibacterium xanthum]MBX7435134.1 cytochrome P450 [Mycolicibacterium xanthum]